jgi:hypothetical protein
METKIHSQNSVPTVCQNCTSNFQIEPEDFLFYQKIKVPPPTFCPECRLIRRLVWRNEHNLYKRSCLTKDGEKMLLANYHPDVPFPVYEQEYWWSDAWDSLIYGKDYDFSRPFFEQLKELITVVPQPHATNLQNSASDFCNFTYQCKNCYLVFASDMNEDSSYLHQTMKSKNSGDLEGCENMESCYMGYKSKGCYQTSYTYFSHNCIDSHLMWDCYNCQDCFGCVELRNKSHCIFNEQYSKEEYDQKIKEYRDGSHLTLQKNLAKFYAFACTFPKKFSDILQSENVTGNHIRNARNCYQCFDIANKMEQCKFTGYAFSNVSDCYDLFAGGVNYETSYETMSAGENAQRMFMSAMVWTCSNVYYSLFCHQSSNLFGCVALRNKQYCIFNKQYTKEEYEALVPKIIEHMNAVPYTDVKGRVYRFGEFFPSELSPFAYNETPAQDYYPITESVAKEKGFTWRLKEKSNHAITMPLSKIPDAISEITEVITNEVIECEDASKEYSPGAFRITAQELALYKRLKIPLPHKSPNARYYERLAFRFPYALWHRSCMCEKSTHNHAEKCPNEFETPYAPERPETVFCESCYQKEVV